MIHSLTLWIIRGSEAEDGAPPFNASLLLHRHRHGRDDGDAFQHATALGMGHGEALRRSRPHHVPLRPQDANLRPQLRAAQRLRPQQPAHAGPDVGLPRHRPTARHGDGPNLLAVRPVWPPQPRASPARLASLVRQRDPSWPLLRARRDEAEHQRP
eukprot:766923-Heterocapsa_arctica.AAC.1